jgi:hypothetical protein
MNELSRRFRGKIRQNRSEKFNLINEAVNATSQIIVEHYESRKLFLSREQLKSFKVLIMSTEIDFPLAYLNSQQIIKLYPTQVAAVDIMTPVDMTIQGLDARIRIVNEINFLGNKAVNNSILKFHERNSWIKQQYLKMKYVSSSELPVLILDADTFLKQPIFLFDDQSHSLLIGTQDYHYPYTSHARNFYKRPQPLLNFVNHLQIQIPAIYKGIFPTDFDAQWIEWVSLGKVYGEDSAVSEFQTYAGQILNQTKYKPIITSLYHETINVENMTSADFIKYFNSYEGDLLTAGNKLLINL